MTTTLAFDRTPLTFRPHRKWVLWKKGWRDKEPYQVNNVLAKSNDPSTWNTFDAVVTRFNRGGYLGIGYVFAEYDPYCGVDLDSCRDPETGVIQDWAVEIIKHFATYAEVSPSQTGVKLFCIAKSPLDSGKNKKLDGPAIRGKQPGIEIYDQGRYFAMTGWKLDGMPDEPVVCQAQLDELCKRYWKENLVAKIPQGSEQGYVVTLRTCDRIDRARKYVAKLPPAISGSRGHDAAYKVACKLVIGFALSPEEAYHVFLEYNDRCVPPWSEREIWHKLHDADKQPGERGSLLNRELSGENSNLKKSQKVPHSNAAKYGLQPVRLCATGGTL